MTALHIKELRLRNYRSFRNARLPLSDLTFLVGRNASGKSSLLDALDFIRESLTDSLPVAIERRGGMEGLRHRLAGDDELVEVAVVLSVVLDVDEKGGFVSAPRNAMHVGLDGLPTCSVIYGFSVDRSGTIVQETLRSEGDRLPGYVRSAAGFVPLAGTDRWEPSVPMDVLLLPLLGGHSAADGARAVSVQGNGWQSFYPRFVRGSLASFGHATLDAWPDFARTTWPKRERARPSASLRVRAGTDGMGGLSRSSPHRCRSYADGLLPPTAQRVPDRR